MEVKILTVLKRVVVFMTLGCIYLLYSPILLPFEASNFPLCYVDYDGALSFNNALDRSELIASGDLPQPEALEYKDGKIITSLGDGRLAILENDVLSDTLINISDATKRPSRPLGLRFFKGDLYIADGLIGLLKLDMKTGALTTLLSTSEQVRGCKLTLPDDLDIDDQGIIYLSDMSTKWDLHRVMYGLYGRVNDGRVISFDTRTGKTDVVLDNLYGPNGIQLTYDKKALLIAETMGRRIIKYHLKGARKGMKEVFSRLPGEPDNLRASSSGGYWVVLPFSSSAQNPHFMDYWTSSPKSKKIVARLSNIAATGLSFLNRFVSLPVLQTWEAQLIFGTHFLNVINLDRPTIIELDAEGNIIRSLQSDNPKYSLLTHPLEKNGYLYLGTFVHNYIVKVKL